MDKATLIIGGSSGMGLVAARDPAKLAGAAKVIAAEGGIMAGRNGKE